MRNSTFSLRNSFLFRTNVLLISFVFFSLLTLTSCTPTNQALTDLVGGEAKTTTNGPLGNSALGFTPTLKDFGALATNSGTDSQVFTVTNTSNSNVVLGAVTGATTHFSINSGTCYNHSNLNKGETCTITVTFAPTAAGQFSTAVTIPYDVSGSSTFYSAVSVSGSGTNLTSFAGLDSLSNLTTTSMKLNWTDVAGADSYQTYRITASGTAILLSSATQAASCVAGSCAYTAGGLNPSTSYTFRVRATDANTVQEQNLVNRSATTDSGYLELSGPAVSLAGDCTAFAVITKDATGTAINMTTNTAITISSLGNGGIYTASGCAVSLSAPTILSGQSSQSFYFKNTTAEAISMAASATTYTGDTHAHTTGHNTADHFVYVSGNSQTALPNAKTANPLIVKITDRYGNGVSNAAVGFMVERGNGIPEPQYTTTDSSGNAQTYLRVSSQDRINKLVARRVGSLLPDAASTGNTQYTLTATTSTAAISALNYIISSTNPLNFATGDIDSDGDQDFMVSNYTSATVSVYKNLGVGAFTAATTYAGVAGNSGFELELYDIDKDGDLDMVMANNGTTISYRYNDGTGTFGVRTDKTATAGTLGIAIADYNSDTWPDFAVTSNSNARVEIYLNNGAGGFTTTSAAITAGTNPRTILADDFNGDSNKDLVWTNLGDDTVSISTGNGDGTFNARTNYAVGDGPFYLISKDINGDSKKDLIVNNNTAGTTSVLLGNGDGTFNAQTSYPACTTVREMAVEDFDADGDQDVASSCWGENKIIVMNGNGTGVLAAPTTYTAMSSTTMTLGIAAADFDGDGKKDLINSFYTTGNYVSILYNKGTSFTPFPKNPSDSGVSTISPVVADFDGDNVIDIAMSDQSNNAVRVYLGNNNGSFQAGSAYTGTSPTAIHVADMDRDGYLDLVSSGYTSGGTGQAINIYTGAAAGVFNAATTLTTCPGPFGIALRDFNRDAYIDIGVSCYANNTAGYLRVHLSLGNGAFAPGVDYTTFGTGPLYMDVADLTGDGILDLIAPVYTALTGTKLSYFPGVGDGTFGARQDYVTGAGTPAPINSTTGDMDNDGDLDIIVTNYNTTNISILFNNAGDFSTRTSYNTLQRPRGVTVTDLNGDGNLDLVINSQLDLAIMVFYGTGTGTLGTRRDYYNPDALYFNTPVDINGDGKLEIVNSSAGSKSFLLMQAK